MRRPEPLAPARYNRVTQGSGLGRGFLDGHFVGGGSFDHLGNRSFVSNLSFFGNRSCFSNRCFLSNRRFLSSRRFNHGVFNRGNIQRADIDARIDHAIAAALGCGSGNRVALEAHSTAGVIVGRDGESDAIGRNIRIKHRDDRDTQHVGFLDRQFFLVGIDHEHHVGNAAHIADTA